MCLYCTAGCQICLQVRGISFSVYQEPLLATRSFAGCGWGRTCQASVGTPRLSTGPARGVSHMCSGVGKASRASGVCAVGSVSVLSLARLWRSSTLLERLRPPGLNLKAGDSRLTAGLGLSLCSYPEERVCPATQARAADHSTLYCLS